MKNANETKFVAAIDTSTDMLACTVARIDGVDGSIDVLASGDHLCRRHANVELIDTLDATLARAGVAREQLDAYVVGRGPGSFTGVRIGISTAKGLAYGENAPLYGTSTLDASAWTAWLAGVRGLLGVAADAMRGEVYPALYRLDDAGVCRLFDRERVVKAAVAVEEWAGRADAAELQLTGDGLVRYGDRFEEAGLTSCIDRSLWWPSGEGLLRAWRVGAAMVILRSCFPSTRVFPMPKRTSASAWDLPRASRARLLVWQMSSQGDICNSGRWVLPMRKPRQMWNDRVLRTLHMRRGARLSFWRS